VINGGQFLSRSVIITTMLLLRGVTITCMIGVLALVRTSKLQHSTSPSQWRAPQRHHVPQQSSSPLRSACFTRASELGLPAPSIFCSIPSCTCKVSLWLHGYSNTATTFKSTLVGVIYDYLQDFCIRMQCMTVPDSVLFLRGWPHPDYNALWLQLCGMQVCS
jgi:hypothetical protein